MVFVTLVHFLLFTILVSTSTIKKVLEAFGVLWRKVLFQVKGFQWHYLMDTYFMACILSGDVNYALAL